MPEAVMTRAQPKKNGKADREQLLLPGVVGGGVWFFWLYGCFLSLFFLVPKMSEAKGGPPQEPEKKEQQDREQRREPKKQRRTIKKNNAVL